MKNRLRNNEGIMDFWCIICGSETLQLRIFTYTGWKILEVTCARYD